jgi:hypothetical protein
MNSSEFSTTEWNRKNNKEMEGEGGKEMDFLLPASARSQKLQWITGRESRGALSHGVFEFSVTAIRFPFR